MTYPITVDAHPEEGWVSWLVRLAERYQCSLLDLYRDFGLPTSGSHGWPRHFGDFLADAEASELAQRTGLTQSQLQRLHLARFAGEVLDPARFTAEIPSAARRRSGWFLSSGTQVCPRCLEEDVSPLRFRLGWDVMCTQHDQVLLRHCPVCGHVPLSAVHSGRPIEGARVRLPIRFCRGARSGQGAGVRICGWDLAASHATVPMHAHRQIQRLTDELVSGTPLQSGLVGHLRFRGWQLLACAVSESLGPGLSCRLTLEALARAVPAMRVGDPEEAAACLRRGNARVTRHLLVSARGCQWADVVLRALAR